MMLEVFGHYHHHPLHKASTEFDPKRYDCVTLMSTVSDNFVLLF